MVLTQLLLLSLAGFVLAYIVYGKLVVSRFYRLTSFLFVPWVYLAVARLRADRFHRCNRQGINR